MLVERKVSFNQNAVSLGRRWTRVPQKPTPKILLNLESFKGKQEVISVNHWDRASDWSPYPTVYRHVCRLIAFL